MGQIAYIVTDEQHAAFRKKLIEAGALTPGVRSGPGRPHLSEHAIFMKKTDLIRHGLLTPGAGRPRLEFDDGWFPA